MWRKTLAMNQICWRRLASKRYQSQRYGQDYIKNKKYTSRWLTAVAITGASAAVIYSYSIRTVQAKETENVNQDIKDKLQTSNSNLTITDANDRILTAVKRSRYLINRIQNERGIPGLSVAVSVDGKIVWSEGFGYSDVENQVVCQPNTIMRIASISKPISAAIAAKLWENGELDLDAPIQKYVKTFPEKTFDNQPVTITTRMLLSHLAGIRAYEKIVQDDDSANKKDDNNDKGKDKVKDVNSKIKLKADTKEIYSKEKYESVLQSLQMFQDDPLVVQPGTKYHYTTHGWTVLSAVLEGASNKKFLDLLSRMFKELDMKYTRPDYHDKIIYHRSKYYVRSKKGILRNCPYVDISYKWAGGGLLSNVEDLVKFGNIMLYSKQYTTACKLIADHEEGNSKLPKSYLKSETIEKMWTPTAVTVDDVGFNTGYGMGWVVANNGFEIGCGYQELPWVSHSGGAVGCSSILTILLPNEVVANKPAPQGVVVAILANLENVSMTSVSRAIALEFNSIDK